MNRFEELKDIAKANGGMEMICKNIIDRGSTTISEQEFSAALMEHAKRSRKADESVVKAFSRMIEEDADIRRAYGICKGYAHTEPTSVEVGNTTVSDDSAEAVRLLKEMAEKQRRSFEQVFADPANSKLAARTYTQHHRGNGFPWSMPDCDNRPWCNELRAEDSGSCRLKLAHNSDGHVAHLPVI